MITGIKTRIWRFVLLTAIAGIFSWVPGVCAQDASPRKATKQVKPLYPPLAAQLKLTGAVKVAVTIAPGGKVTSAHAIGGHPVLVTAAEYAANHWEFEASSRETTQTLEFKFSWDSH